MLLCLVDELVYAGPVRTSHQSPAVDTDPTVSAAELEVPDRREPAREIPFVTEEDE